MPGYRSRSANATPVWLADDDGNPLSVGKQETLTLASNVSAAGAQPPQSAYGGDYVFSATWTGSATVQLQAIGPDGATYQNIGAAKAAPDTTGGTGVGIGSNATVRVNVTGTPTGLYATLSRLP